MTALILSANEARVLAALVEKSITVPQYYPLTINALMMAANQKSSRHPVMTLSEGEVGAALTRLEADRLVARDDHSGRVPKWRQRLQHQLLLKPPALALLVTLMLRGPQTAAELRAGAAALGGPDDGDAWNAALADLADRAQPLVVLLPRAPGQSAARYAQLLCGAPAPDEGAPARTTPRASNDRAGLEERLLLLEARIAELERRLDAP